MNDYEFTNNWFEINAKGIWDALLPQLKPTSILEIGSYEGKSATYLINNSHWSDTISITCIDTWSGGIEHQERKIDMLDVEKRFDNNSDLALRNSSPNKRIYKIKNTSDKALCEIYANTNKEIYDFIYIDGSHQAPDVLSDAILSFKLLKKGGVIGFDDYLWSENLAYGKDLLRCPKPAIDAFINIHFKLINIIETSNRQIYIQKK
mgnify:CR=1 FL=1